MIDAFRSGARRPRVSARMPALAVLACALLLRLLVPAGWMPVSDASGYRLTLCTGTGPMTMPMPMADGMKMGAGVGTMVGMAHHMPTDQQGTTEHPCAFAYHGLALAEPPHPGLGLPVAPSTLIPAGLAGLVSIGRGLAAPPPPQTGPPSIA